MASRKYFSQVKAMNMMNDVFYELSEEDIQTVAEDELGRKLTKKELKLIKEDVPERIHWYEIIASSINDKIISIVE